jgi:hypothetical protein
MVLQPLPENFDGSGAIPMMTGYVPIRPTGGPLGSKSAAPKPLTPEDIVMLKGKPYNIQRARMLIRNFIFIK